MICLFLVFCFFVGSSTDDLLGDVLDVGDWGLVRGCGFHGVMAIWDLVWSPHASKTLQKNGDALSLKALLNMRRGLAFWMSICPVNVGSPRRNSSSQ